MRRLVEYRLGGQDEGTVLVEVVEPVEEASGEEQAAFRSWRKPMEASVSLEEALERIRPAADMVLAKLRRLAVAPDETQVAFGVKLTASAGAVLASAGVEANYMVTLKWTGDSLAREELLEG
jgi:hypothetical protein